MTNVLVGLLVLLGAAFVTAVVWLLLALAVYSQGNDRWAMWAMCAVALLYIADTVGELWRDR